MVAAEADHLPLPDHGGPADLVAEAGRTRTAATGVGLTAVISVTSPGREGHRAHRAGGLGVADGPAGVGQEDVVEAGPG